MLALSHAGRHAIVSLPEQEPRAVSPKPPLAAHCVMSFSSASVNSSKKASIPLAVTLISFDLQRFASVAAQHFCNARSDSSKC